MNSKEGILLQRKFTMKQTDVDPTQAEFPQFGGETPTQNSSPAEVICSVCKTGERMPLRTHQSGRGRPLAKELALIRRTCSNLSLKATKETLIRIEGFPPVGEEPRSQAKPN